MHGQTAQQEIVHRGDRVEGMEGGEVGTRMRYVWRIGHMRGFRVAVTRAGVKGECGKTLRLTDS